MKHKGKIPLGGFDGDRKITVKESRRKRKGQETFED